MNAPTRTPARLRAALATLVTALLVVGGASLPASAAPGDVTAATLQWGVKQSFRTYISGAIAQGGWTVSGNASDTIPFSWTAGTGSADQAAATGAVGYSGGIHFQGHEGLGGIGAGNYALDLTISNVRVVQTGATAAQLVVDTYSNSLAAPSTFVTSADVAFADIDLAAATPTSTSTTVGFSAAPATLTSAGAAAFAGFYSAGTALDPVTFSWPVEQAPVPSGPTVTISKSTEISPAGEIITVTGAGFGPVAPSTNGTRPPLAGQFGGVYVAFGKFAAVWKPSESAPSSARKTGAVTWVVDPANLATVDPTASGTAVAINADGSFSVQLLVKRGFSGEPATGNYGIYTYAGSGAVYAPFETYTPVAFTAATATAIAVTATPASALVEGDTLTLSAQVSPVAAGTVSFLSGATVLGSAVVDASGLATLDITGIPAGAQSYTAEFTPTSPLLFAGSSGSVSLTVGTKVIGAGSLSWGIKTSFSSYVTGIIAKGSISATGVAVNGGVFTFGQQAGGSFSAATGLGSSPYTGSVRFFGHGGLLDVTLANPVVVVTSATSATLYLSANGGGSIPFASLDLAAATKTTPNNTVSYSGVPAVLTSQGAAVFTGYYSAGEPLDPVGFVIGSSSVSGTGSKTVASFSGNDPAPAPPATTGVTLSNGEDPADLEENGEYSFEAAGFAAGETGILFVHYSDPVVLADDLAADSSGVVSWTGRLPVGLTGEHTFTFQGSVDRGIVVTIAPTLETLAVGSCRVEGDELTWGFKESFRSYISGSIANGEWTVANGARYETPNFSWTEATGGYDPGSGEGLVAFTGSITFTGHDGLLNTTVADPQIRFDDAETAYLVLDVTGTTQEGAEIEEQDVEFVRLDLSSATVETADDGTVTISGAPAVLTAQGAQAFGTYESGEEFDPVTVSFATGADCAHAVAPTEEGPIDDDLTSADLGWLVWVAALVVVLLAVVATVVVVRRRPAA